MKKWIVTGLGTGYLPIAPGTWGAAAVAGAFFLIAWGTDGSAVWSSAGMLALAAAASAACVGLGRFTERHFDGKDPRQCTLDEWAGQALTYVLLPLGSGCLHHLITVGVGFGLFRLFDIVKPPPARALERLPGGWGVLLDDLVAGLYANAAAQLILRLWVFA